MGSMGEMGRQTEEQLALLLNLIPGARLCRVQSFPERPRPEILPFGIDLGSEKSTEERPHLPTMVAELQGRTVHLEFIPAPEPDTWWMNLYVSGSSPVPLALTALNTAGFGRSTRVVWQSFNTGDQRFDALYDSASSTPDEGREILADPATRERILAMGEIERFTLESRFVRLIRLVDEFSDIEAEALNRTIREMVQLAGHLESQAALKRS